MARIRHAVFTPARPGSWQGRGAAGAVRGWFAGPGLAAGRVLPLFLWSGMAGGVAGPPAPPAAIAARPLQRLRRKRWFARLAAVVASLAAS